MYGIRTVCRNPACQAVFRVEFAGIGPLEGKTPELVIKLSEGLRGKDFTTNKGEQVPVFIECPKCNSVFPGSDLTFFAYNASAK